mmetsp:Transcript_68535/g.135464  ORF Transcript_68535/g.135464 Transcript_68535/m.135464 type:complete len:293 (+) Transcript_68535:98-976(+)
MSPNGLRWTLPNFLSVSFVLWIIFTIWALYCWLHLVPLLQPWADPVARDEANRHRGMIEACASQTLTGLFAVCYLRAMFTNPGVVPETPEWRPGRLEASATNLALREAKRTGERRFCAWCNGYKPDRCHHCRICKTCILRMDHHCPWLATCVGYRNHKYFFLSVFYALLACGFVVITMSASLWKALYVEEVSSLHRFLLMFGMTLTTIMAVLLKFFFAFHVRLMFVATTTVEFCEKKTRRLPGSWMPDYRNGWYEDIRAVLGPQPFLWLLPLGPPSGNGLTFPLANEDKRCN